MGSSVLRGFGLQKAMLKKIGFGYLVFGIGFCVGVAFAGVLGGLYGYQLDASAMPPAFAAVQLH